MNSIFHLIWMVYFCNSLWFKSHLVFSHSHSLLGLFYLLFEVNILITVNLCVGYLDYYHTWVWPD